MTLPVAIFGLVLLLLAVAAVLNEEARPAHAVSLFALVFAFGMTVRQQRQEHEPDEQPSRLTLLNEAFEGYSLIGLALAAFVVVFLVLDETGPLAAVLASGSIITNAYLTTRKTLARPGVERERFLMATCIAFTVTMTACGVWAMCQTFVDAPQLDIAAPWLLGICAWFVASEVLERRAA